MVAELHSGVRRVSILCDGMSPSRVNALLLALLCGIQAPPQHRPAPPQTSPAFPGLLQATAAEEESQGARASGHLGLLPGPQRESTLPAAEEG